MRLVETLEDLRKALAGLSRPVGLVPTMGYLHAGHLSLVQRARQECNSVVVSIYVNPSQFGPQEDLNKYPRNLSRDLEMLSAENVDLVWTPGDTVMYPPGYQTWITVEQVTQPLEGAFRPTHFRGVSTVVAKLFNAVQPQKAYFGQKDAQQAVVIRTMSRDLGFPIGIVVCPIVREPDGLAMSSRNVYLKPDERQAAVVLSRGLFKARENFEAGERESSRLRQIVVDTIATQSLVKVQYVSCADPQTLQELEGQVEHALISLAVTVGKTRLIDNVIV
ncbi:MAG: pantoate--beta-alanine ligase [Anaerolineales bacterium]|nr:pantoate--beta-alanine ligase [Anaerolineae bacterium]PWB54140.1 MAG: pantoate--beta-alanine ligase [Anaerolineales bacterium]